LAPIKRFIILNVLINFIIIVFGDYYERVGNNVVVDTTIADATCRHPISEGTCHSVWAFREKALGDELGNPASQKTKKQLGLRNIKDNFLYNCNWV